MGLAGLLLGAISLTSLIEYAVGDELWQVVALHSSVAAVAAILLLLCWLPAARSDPEHPQRRLRLALAILAGAVLSSLAADQLMQRLPWPSVCDIIARTKREMRCDDVLWTDIVGDTLWIFLPAALIAGVLEILQQRERQEDAAHALLLEHTQLRQRELAARLATLQAQVEPALLFQALVGIQQAYAEHEPEAGARIERLIHHLRLALPRLREREQALANEVDLIRSYLEVMQDLDGHALHFEADAARLKLPPMLLLPLVQRAVRLGPPTRGWLQVRGRSLVLGFDRPGLCEEDAELRGLHERLAVLDIQLGCQAGESSTEFTLRLPS
jgi:hypothetical protein